jgi:hypothetical protein
MIPILVKISSLKLETLPHMCLVNKSDTTAQKTEKWMYVEAPLVGRTAFIPFCSVLYFLLKKCM